MPSRNLTKISVKNSFYHIYNRGVEKRIIFEDDQDYKVFLSYLKEYLSVPPKPEELSKTFTLKGVSFKGVPRQPKNYFGKIELHAYCLMSNHFHLLIRQVDDGAMELFMRSIATRYSMYFNKRYGRVGTLFQDTYKAAIVNEENYLLHLSRYIHINPSEFTTNLLSCYSSYAEYLGVRRTSWITTTNILSFFGKAKADFIKTNSYKNFVEKSKSGLNYYLGENVLGYDDL